MVFEAMNPTLAVTIIAAIVLLVINVFYRFLINQNKAADLKERVKFLTEESKKNKESPEKSKEFLTEMMKSQRDLMKMNMKPMIISLVVVALALPFLAEEFEDVFAKVDSSTIGLNGNSYQFSLAGSKLDIDGKQCELPCSLSIENKLWRFSLDKDRLKSYVVVAVLPFSLPVLGNEFGWILWYILVSIPLAIIIRAAYGIRT